MLASEWAKKHHAEDELHDVLFRVKSAIEVASRVAKPIRGGVRPPDASVEMATDPPDPGPTDGQGIGYRGPGADPVLELCWRHLSLSDEQKKAQVAAFMRQSQKIAHAFVTAAVRERFPVDGR